MLVYILKSSTCLVVFMLFYSFFLEKESIHTFKRFYLLTALALAFGIPLITFTQYIETPLQVSQLVLENNTAETKEGLSLYFPIILWSIYGLGVLVFGIKFLFNLSQMIFKIKQNPKRRNHKTTHVLLQESITPHTFFSFIFLNKQKAEMHQIPKEVILHEETHAKQKHSLDIILTELIQVVFWCNPILYITKRAIKLNHEFLADQEVLNKGVSPSTYQQILLAFSSDAREPQLANAINYSLIKKRFTIMKTQTSRKTIWIRSLLSFPLLAILLFSFSNKEIIEKEKLDHVNERMIVNQQKATAAQVAEYNKLAKKYNSMPKDSMIIKSSDIKRLKYLYSIMSDKQRKKAEPFPNIPPPAPKTSNLPKVKEITIPPAPKTSNVPKVKEVTIPTAPKSPNAPKTEEITPPPPVPEKATPAQKKKYSEAIKSYNLKVAKMKHVKAENQKHKLKKDELVRIKEVQLAEHKEKIKLEKMAYKEAKLKQVELKQAYKEEQLTKVQKLREENEAYLKIKKEELKNRSKEKKK